jgi:hypothetical protein
MILAQIALSELFSEDYREEIIQRVLEYRKNVEPELRALLERSLNKNLRISGFKHPIRAPLKKVAREAAAHLFCCPGVLESVLDVWFQSHEELRQAVARNIKQPSLALQQIFDVKNDQPVRWTAQITELIRTVKLELPANEDDIALMICCLVDVLELRVGEGKLDLIKANSPDAESSETVEPAYAEVGWS